MFHLERIAMTGLDDDQLREWAGKAVFKRGLAYFREGRVQLSRADEDGFDAKAEGSQTYRLSLRRKKDNWNFDCDCPAGGFCKHLVAAALAWREGERAPEQTRDTLLQFLEAQPAERLAQWLREFADEDPAIDKRLQLLAAQDDPHRLRKSLRAMLAASGFLDWRRGNDYARRLDTPLRLLKVWLWRDPQQCLALCEDALNKLLKVYANSDDSSGAIGGRVEQFATLHRHAAAAAAHLDRARFARTLLALQKSDEWGFFALDAYWDALGTEGQAQYASLVEADFAGLPMPHSSDHGDAHWTQSFAVVHRMEHLARLRSDFDSLQRLLSRDLSSGLAYEKLVLACREFGRDREALQWAERGVRAHPRWGNLRPLLAEELQRAGFDDEARKVLWQDFTERPAESSWQRLKGTTGADWPALRQRALEHLRSREPRTADGRSDASLCVALLLADGDAEAALELALQAAVQAECLLELARHIERSHPAEAAGLLRRAVNFWLPSASARDYARLTELIAAAHRLAPGDDLSAWLSHIRVQYRARRKLMELLAAQGL